MFAVGTVGYFTNFGKLCLCCRFRYINEKLYTISGQEAMNMFCEDPQAFEIYHQGYADQIDQWPELPVTGIIEELKKKYILLNCILIIIPVSMYRLPRISQISRHPRISFSLDQVHLLVLCLNCKHLLNKVKL